jgi:hypothetical protein
LIAYGEYQFGASIPGCTYRKMPNGEKIDNWSCEIEIMIPLYIDLASIYMSDESISLVARDNLSHLYFKNIIDMLKPWSANFDLNSTSRVVSLSKDRTNYILMLLSQTERTVASIHLRRNEFDLADDYCQRAVSHARLFEGVEEDKTDMLSTALRVYCNLNRTQGNYAAAVTIAEESYNCVAMTYNPVHPEVHIYVHIFSRFVSAPLSFVDLYSLLSLIFFCAYAFLAGLYGSV